MRISMRKGHIIAGLSIFSVGLFFVYMNSVLVVTLIKGVVQPIFILIGLALLAAAIFAKKEYRVVNSILAGIFLLIGLYGLFAGGDEYYATLDFFNGFLPILLIGAGAASLIHGIKELT